MFEMEVIYLDKIVEGKNTYPNWTTGSVYIIKTEERSSKLKVFYYTKSNKIVSRLFPINIQLTPKLAYVFGFLKGEGSTSRSKANYRRFTITNSDYKIMRIVLEELDKSELFHKSNLINKSIHLAHHTKLDEEVIEYWSKGLDLPKEKFKCFKSHPGRNPYGVCHIYISDVLLRRVIDIIHEEVFSKEKSEE